MNRPAGHACPKEILHLGKYFPPEPGGMEYVLKSLVECTRGGLSHYCIVADRNGPTRTREIPGGTVHYLKERGTILLSPILPGLPILLHRLRRKNRFFVLMLHYPNPTAFLALLLSLLARTKRERIAVWYHADVVLEERWKRALYLLFRPVEEFIFRRTDAFVAASPNHLSQSPSLSRFRERTSVIPFAVPDDWFDISPEEEAAARSARERMGGRYLLFVGRLVPYKGLDTLLRAAGSVGCPVAVVGTGPLEDSLRKEIVARGLQERVRLLGRADDLRPWYLGSEFLVLPSNSPLEAFGIVQIEAMALGRPVVSSDLPTGVTYVNRHGETGLTFPVGDADAFAAACNRLLEDDELRVRLGKAARERAMREFSYAAMGRELVGFFRRLCGDPGK